MNSSSSEHTLAHFRGAIFTAQVLVRIQRSQTGERESMVRRAEKEVERILSSEREPILEPGDGEGAFENRKEIFGSGLGC